MIKKKIAKNRKFTKSKVTANREKKTNSRKKAEIKNKRMTFIGKWYITEMEMWDERAFNCYQQAYVTIKQNGMGEFAFCVVEAYMNGEIVNDGGEKRWKFTFEGNDEYDPVSGKGWIKLKNANTIKGKIKFHNGDSSKFWAERAKK